MISKNIGVTKIHLIHIKEDLSYNKSFFVPKFNKSLTKIAENSKKDTVKKGITLILKLCQTKKNQN